VPSAAVLALVHQTQEKLHMGKARAIIGVQIRTGAADQPRNPSVRFQLASVALTVRRPSRSRLPCRLLATVPCSFLFPSTPGS
jgi:hypothetical protein